MVVSNKYTLRYNGTDLTFENGLLVVNWLGGGINDVAATTPYGSGDLKERRLYVNEPIECEEDV